MSTLTFNGSILIQQAWIQIRPSYILCDFPPRQEALVKQKHELQISSGTFTNTNTKKKKHNSQMHWSDSLHTQT